MNPEIERAVDWIIAQSASAVVVRPGDTLILRIGHNTSQDLATHFKKAIQDRLPNVDVVVLNADEMFIYRPAEAAAS